ncbi:MAG: replication protein [Pseudomonadota bacterium]
MSSPQLENGYTKIANEIMEALSKYRIPGEQMQCLLFLLRKTYGYNKLCDRISNSQYVVGTGINKRNVKRALDGLIEKRIVVKKDNEYIPTYQFNKDYRLWRLLSKKTTSCQKRPKQLSKKTDTKEILQKKVFLSDSIEYRLSNYLYSWIKKNNPSAKEPNFQSWCKHIDLTIRVDKIDPNEIKRVIEWCQKDSFWFKNILSTDKLRKHFVRLKMQIDNKGPISEQPKQKIYTPENIGDLYDN